MPEYPEYGPSHGQKRLPVGRDDRFIGKIERHQRPGFDTRRRVANDELKVHRFQ